MAQRPALRQASTFIEHQARFDRELAELVERVAENRCLEAQPVE